MKRNILSSFFALMGLCVLTAPGVDGAELKIPRGYSLETIEPPEGVRLEVGGLAFTKDGALLVCTRAGDVWIYRHGQGGGDWRLFADGLHEPLGIAVDPETEAIYVGQRTEITQLVDEDGDGKADLYRKVGGGWGYSGNYHEYAFGPVRDREGNFYMTLNLSHSPGVRNSVMGSLAPYRGWAMKISPEGEMTPFAFGMRSPAGLGINRKGEIFYTENQGDYVATSAIYQLVEGRFYGHPSSLADHPDFSGRDLENVSMEELAVMRTLPAVWFPHRELADSPGEVSFDETGGKFGPFEDQIFVGDQNRANVVRVMLEKVGGEYQGAAFEFMNGLASGAVRSVFGPDGSLWIGQMDHGWGNLGGAPFALQRLVWDGQTVPFEVKTMELLPDGFRLTFTKPVDKALAGVPDNYSFTHWHYAYHSDYGSPKIDETTPEVISATVSADGRVVDLELPDLLTERVYEISLPNIQGAAGETLVNSKGWYTLNRLVDTGAPGRSLSETVKKEAVQY